MTVAQALNMIAPVRLIVMGRQVFFNTWDEEEAVWWSTQGAIVRPYYSENAVRFTEQMRQGWEIHPLGACDRIMVTKLNGELQDVTAQELVNEARASRQKAGV